MGRAHGFLVRTDSRAHRHVEQSPAFPIVFGSGSIIFSTAARAVKPACSL